MIPKSLLILFIGLTLLTSGGTIFTTANNENMTTQQKITKISITTLNTPNAVDDFCAKSIDIYTSENSFSSSDNNASEVQGSMEDAMKKYSLALIVISLIGIFLIFRIIYRIVKWFVDVGYPPSSQQRENTLSFVIAIGLFGLLTHFSFILAMLGDKTRESINSFFSPLSSASGNGLVIVSGLFFIGLIIVYYLYSGGGEGEKHAENLQTEK